MLLGQTLTMAPLLPSVVAELGAAELAEFGGHLALLAVYTMLHTAAQQMDGEAAPLGDAAAPAGEGADVTTEEFQRMCQRDAWRYGSGLD